MSESEAFNEQFEKRALKDEFVSRALESADRLCTAVMRGKAGQQRLALDFARVIDDAKRAGHTLIEGQ